MANTHYRMKISFIRQAISALFGLGAACSRPNTNCVCQPDH